MTREVPLVFGRYEWRPAQRRLLVDGQAAPLRARAIDVLDALIEHRDRVVSKNELLALVWQGLIVEENNLQVHVSALRKVLGSDHITTVPGRGYRFTAPLDGAAPAAATVPPAVAPVATGNLPPETTPLIGREADLPALSALVRTNRLVSVLGPGGVGKTRLALAAARQLQPDWRDGAWLVELASISDGSHLPQALAQALRIDAGDTQQVARQLQGRRMLLVLDNCEHILAAAAGFVDDLLVHTDALHILATSQEPLRLSGEQQFRTSPLAVPARGDVPDPSLGAMRLFAERARTADPRFVLEAGNLAAAAEVCRQLDGLPLAIELAAARVPLLGAQGLAERLDERLRLLRGSTHGVAARHRTLRAALEWSHSLLSPEESTVFRRLGVFVGGFSLDLAQHVAADDAIDAWSVLDALGGLVDKSLVTVDAGEPPRYRLLESARLFALEQLAADGEIEAVRRRHVQAVCALFVAAADQRYGDDGRATLAEFMAHVGAEIDNARAALDCAERSGDWPAAVTLAGAAAHAFMQLGLTVEIGARMQALAPHADDRVTPANAALFWRMLKSVGSHLGMHQSEAIACAQRAVDLSRASGSRHRLLDALYMLGTAHAAAGRFDQAQQQVDEMVALERTGDPPRLRGHRYHMQHIVARQQGRLEEALNALSEEQVWLAGMPEGKQGLLRSRYHQCVLLNALSRHDEAIPLARALLATPGVPSDFGAEFELIEALAASGHVEEAVAIARRQRDQWTPVLVLKFGTPALMQLAAARGRPVQALRIHAATLAYLESEGAAAGPIERSMTERLRQRCALSMPAAEVERRLADVAPLEEHALVALALDD